MNLRALFLFAHLLGVVLWLGLSFTLSFVTGRAARDPDPSVGAFAYRTAARTLRTLGVAGVLLTLAGGIGLISVTDFAFFRPFPHHWLFQMQLLGFVAAALALFYQIPVAERLARAAEARAGGGEVSDASQAEAFAGLRKRNAIVGSLIGFLLIVLVGLGTFRVP
jgi:hypothetical protein